jgi:hypothetical protein
MSLPPEIHREIIRQADAVTSTCLGLTCKCFYPTHRKLKKEVPLYCEVYPMLGDNNGPDLGSLLTRWVAKAGLSYDRDLSRFFIGEEQRIKLRQYSRLSEKEQLMMLGGWDYQEIRVLREKERRKRLRQESEY